VSTATKLPQPPTSRVRHTRSEGEHGQANRAQADPAVLAAIVDAGARGPAAELPASLRAAFGARFGIDLDGVRVHRSPTASAAADALGARAFTFGRDIVVGAGGDDPATLAHEAAHAAQFARHGAPGQPRGVASHIHPAHTEARAGAAPTASPGGLVQRQEKTEEEKTKADEPTTKEGALLASLERTETGRSIYSVLPGQVQALVQGQNFQQGFMATFVPAVSAAITEDDKKALHDEFASPTNTLAFDGGMIAGIYAGIAKDLWSNLEGLYEIVKLGVEYSPVGIPVRVAKEAYALGVDPEIYKRKKLAEVEYAKQLIAALTDFFKRVQSDPAALIGSGEAFGRAAGEYSAHWFHGEFLKRSAFWQGETVGEGVGIVATEVALLFLGPEEWVARGVAAAGKGAKLAAEGTRLGRYVIEILEKAPEIARIFKARTELKAAEEALEANKALKKAEKAAEEARTLEKGLEAAGEAHPRGAPDVPPGAKPEVHAAPEVKPTPEAKVEPPVKEPPKGPPAKKAPEEPPPAKKKKPKRAGEADPAKPKKTGKPRPSDDAARAKVKESPAQKSPTPEKPAPKEPRAKKGPKEKPAVQEPPTKKAPPRKKAPTPEQPVAKEPPGKKSPPEPHPMKEPATGKKTAGGGKKGAAKEAAPATASGKKGAPTAKGGKGPAPYGKGTPRPAAKGKKPPVSAAEKAEEAAVKARKAEARKVLDEMRKKKPQRGSFGESWDYKKYPEGSGRRWQPGDPPNLPDPQGRHPNWKTIRPRVWKNLARNELEARKAGALRDTESLLELDPVKSLTDKELEQMLKSGKGRKGFEIEHKDIPQRIARMLEKAGFSPSEAKTLGQLGDPKNLDPTDRAWHAIVDEAAAKWKSRNPKLRSPIDERIAHPLGSMESKEIEQLLDAIKKRRIDLDATEAGKKLREQLLKEKARWHPASAHWVIP
jgi:hypothetical protein